VSETVKELRAMIARPLSAKELSNARNSQVLSLPGQFDTNASVSASMANTYVYNLGLDYYTLLPQRFASVTDKQVQQVAKKYLQPEKLIVIGVGDQTKIAPQLAKLKLAPLEVRDAEGNVK
jgi:zinc protease